MVPCSGQRSGGQYCVQTAQSERRRPRTVWVVSRPIGITNMAVSAWPSLGGGRSPPALPRHSATRAFQLAATPVVTFHSQIAANG